MIMRLGIIILAIVLALSMGCATQRQDTLANPAPSAATAPQHMLEQPATVTYNAPRPAEGSLWVDPGGSQFFGDRRARQVGDLVTIRITETPTASLTAKTTTTRDSSVSADVTDLAGYMTWLEAANKNLKGDSLLSAGYKPSFTGQGTNDRSGSVTAYVSGRVVGVMANGNLQISGSRAIKVNNETQYMTISGIVRPEDIDPSNVVQSTYIADARIEYYGKGVIADKQIPGWGTRVLDHVWPF
ncbi:Flagellar biosynthesis, basal-body outer-membrane L (lipopolysaccharide layer) ring protein [Desulfatibacillum aliphaticivorans]|uniref:Flagellar L-ring protein n=2 Tax=Desulfatibacillum aliphaticivorans TaxID=218208 RepID=B8FK19_DESAL|nr:Flagellar biosynthesis, basal-body outer-membrane L (lipopolysaccharide layer) ring protein [Desulfatibacillum aliphaticivorans]